MHAASILEPPADRCTHRLMREIAGRLLCEIFQPCFPSKFKRWHDPSCTTGTSADARARRRRCQLEVQGEVTQRSVLDALEIKYPMLQGAIRDHVTQQRRPYIRFFACAADLSHESPVAPLPDQVVAGTEPFFIVGAIAGG